MSARRVALALGSGGARGYAHIGVVDELHERGYEIATVAGTSMGAVVGALTAAGRVDDFSAWARQLRQRDVLRLLDPVWSSSGVIAANRLFDQLSDLFGDDAIEDLPIPFTAVATDLGAGREVWFQQGPLRTAVRASIAIPGLFTPVVLNGALLVDGGLTNPVPVEPTISTVTDLTVAVSLSGPRRFQDWGSAVKGAAAHEERGVPLRERLRRTVASLTGRTPDQVAEDDIDSLESLESLESEGLDPGAAQLLEPTPPRLRRFDIPTLSVEAMQGVIARYRMAATPADVLITVPADAARTLDFHRAEELIELGRRLAAQALDAAT